MNVSIFPSHSARSACIGAAASAASVVISFIRTSISWSMRSRLDVIQPDELDSLVKILHCEDPALFALVSLLPLPNPYISLPYVLRRPTEAAMFESF